MRGGKGLTKHIQDNGWQREEWGLYDVKSPNVRGKNIT